MGEEKSCHKKSNGIIVLGGGNILVIKIGQDFTIQKIQITPILVAGRNQYE